MCLFSIHSLLIIYPYYKSLYFLMWKYIITLLMSLCMSPDTHTHTHIYTLTQPDSVVSAFTMLQLRFNLDVLHSILGNLQRKHLQGPLQGVNALPHPQHHNVHHHHHTHHHVQLPRLHTLKEDQCMYCMCLYRLTINNPA